MKIRIFLLILILTGVSCKKNRTHPVPSIAFDFSIDLTLPSYQDLNSVGGWAYVAGGIKGIIVYRQSTDVFVAWERMSPEDPDNVCATGLLLIQRIFCNYTILAPAPGFPCMMVLRSPIPAGDCANTRLCGTEVIYCGYIIRKSHFSVLLDTSRTCQFECSDVSVRTYREWHTGHSK